jgi:hypothetical protein
MNSAVQITGAEKRIVWLASYPKSGNTWFRAFLAALLGRRELNINDMHSDHIFSSRDGFDLATDLDSTYLYDKEVKELLPEVFTHINSGPGGKKMFIKIHDAYTNNLSGKSIVPEEPTLAALYFIRNPLDIVGSFANHSGDTMDEAVEKMNDPNAYFAKQLGNLNTNPQFRQLILDWSGHVESWATAPFPVLAIRYEDMLTDPLHTFSKAVAFINLQKTQTEIEKAIEASRFENLKAQEKEQGFAEKNAKSQSFFRNGVSGNWRKELTTEQVNLIVGCHKEVMEKYGYDIPDK